MKVKRLLALVVVVCMLIGLTVACAQDTPVADPPAADTADDAAPADDATPADDPPAASEDQVTLRFTTWDTARQLAVYQEVIDIFMEEHPDIFIQVESVPDGYNERLFTAAAAGNAPDVFLFWEWPLLVDGNVIIPLDEFIGTLIDPDLYFAEIFETTKVDGVLWGIPNIPTTRAMYYNRTMFEEAGVPTPTDDWTWDDFVEKAIALTTDDTFGFVTEGRNTYTLQQFVWTNGGAFIDMETAEFDGIMNSAATAEALQWYADLVVVHGVSPTPSASATMGGATEMFLTGQVAMFESGMWPLNTLRQMDEFEIGTAIMPSHNGNRVGILHSSGYAISVDSDFPEQAVTFASWIGGFYGQLEFVRLGYGLPVMPSIAEYLDIASDPLKRAFLEMIQFCTVPPSFVATSQWGLIDDSLATAMELTQMGEISAQDALNEAVENAIMDLAIGH